MTHRSLIDIYEDIDRHTLAIEELRSEVIKVQEDCPHPAKYTAANYTDHYDNHGAPVYETTFATATCSLCLKSATMSYEQDHTDWQPTTEEIFKRGR